MVTGQNRVFGCATNFLRAKKCVFCSSFKVSRTGRGYVKGANCAKQKSAERLRREIAIIQGFYQQVPAYCLAHDLGVDAKVVTRVYQRLREILLHIAELEAAENKLSGEIELDEAYFGGRRKGKRGRGAAGKSVVFSLLERDGRVYTKAVEDVSAETLMAHIRARTRKESVYYTDAFRGYQSLQRYGKHHTVNHTNFSSIKRRRTTSTVSRVFGRLPNTSSTITEGFPNTTFRCILRRLSSGTIIETTTPSSSS